MKIFYNFDMFGDRIKNLRRERKLSQSQLAKDIGTTQRQVSYWEGGVEPDYATLIALCDYFNVSADYILGRTDEQ